MRLGQSRALPRNHARGNNGPADFQSEVRQKQEEQATENHSTLEGESAGP